MLANLAHGAAEAIGANPLLARVCAYFHDIGKLSKPEFFTENSQTQENPHDRLSPTMSTLVITSHVKEGVTLAKRYKLPQPVLDSIQQHHGTAMVSYFYHRAKQQAVGGTGNGGNAASEGDVDSESFRYSGPLPATREMTILALADSVEAASRSLENASPSRIENLVNEIVDGKMRDGQLDQSALTFSELSAVKRSFVFTLTNMLHARIAYPKPNEDQHEQPAEPVED
jgi:putative nucleotidyltransferase with HDIG domain